MGSYSTTIQADERVDISALQTAGKVVLPDSLLTESGSIGARAGDFSAISQNVTNEGFQGEDVAQLLGMVTEDQAASRDALTKLGSSLAAGLQSAQSETAQILAATKAPDSTTLTQIMPLLLLLAVGYLLFK